ncbi:hypothetical protein [Pseudomonas sp. Irchel 3E13]|uniref:hypothetical protein n=1 Tax=Pseudomonas sp. Irchel 3E13 TaxID=2008975 RepID=UPI000BA2CB06|nr:hypothetical protein [Pseudomonas sp. Irchel 3E13]
MDRPPRLLPILTLCLLPLADAVAREPQPCPQPLLDSLATQLQQQGWTTPTDDSDGPLLAAACKRWPDDPALSVVAVAYRDADDLQPAGERSPHLLVAKVDTDSGRLRERLDQDMAEDAELEFGANSLWLDTARYRLAPEVRAFGVVMTSTARGASCPDAGYSNLLTLVVPDVDGLRPVLTTHLSNWTTLKGVSCSEGFEMEQATLTFSVGTQQSQGYADLIVQAQVSSGYAKPVSRTVSKTLRYDGNRYPLDEYPSFWWSNPQP